MFYETTGFELEYGLWYPILPLVDWKGNYAYVDPDLNLLVIVATNDAPEVVYNLTPRSTRSMARLLPATKYEIVVPRKTDRLVIRCPDGANLELELSHGEAYEIWGSIAESIAHAKDRESLNILIFLSEIAKRISIKDVEELDVFIGANQLKKNPG
jgi:hypothetical protein